MELPSPEELTPDEDSETLLDDENSQILESPDFEEIITE